METNNIIVSSVTGGGSSKGSSSSKPWKELGVSEREYMEICNKIKYGLVIDYDTYCMVR